MEKLPYRVDLKGRMFGAIYVRKYAGKAEDGTTLWECRCYRPGCYKIFNIRVQALLGDISKSCGCSSVTHGLTRGPKGSDKPTEYKSWIHAKLRCHDPKNAAYEDYGGWGIVMCSGWLSDYATFFKDLGPKPQGKSLDRLNNDGNYSCGHCQQCLENKWPMNCAWRTPKEQNRNRRSTVYIDYGGKRQSVSAWAEEIGVETKVLCKQLARYKMPAAMVLAKIVDNKKQSL